MANLDHRLLVLLRATCIRAFCTLLTYIDLRKAPCRLMFVGLLGWSVLSKQRIIGSCSDLRGDTKYYLFFPIEIFMRAAVFK